MPRASRASPITRPRPAGSARPPTTASIDSQYNLAILYARGIGVETNLAEAFKWFALASRDGDRDAAKKRDDVAARLDKQSLAAAMAAAQSWQAQPQPDAAIKVTGPARRLGRRAGAVGRQAHRRPQGRRAIASSCIQ